MFKEFC
jgi:flagellin-specific chaperone FliS